jgi:hypothetical protein
MPAAFMIGHHFSISAAWSIRALTRSNSIRVAISGNITSGTTYLPCSFTATWRRH